MPAPARFGHTADMSAPGYRSPFLYYADERLSVAELCAARLDGDLVDLGDAFIPADAVETAALRAAALRDVLGSTLAATRLSAAWIHGGIAEPPARHTVQRAVDRRLHRVFDRRFLYRDPFVPESALELRGGVRVTTPARTIADLAREHDDPEFDLALLGMMRAHPTAIALARATLRNAGALPGKRRALRVLPDTPRPAALREIAAACPHPNQVVVTR